MYKTVINSKISLCFIVHILLIFHAIYGLGRTGPSFITSVRCNSTVYTAESYDNLYSPKNMVENIQETINKYKARY